MAGENTAIIYGLCDPRLVGRSSIRYLGKTSSPLMVRLARHISAARTGEQTYCYNWIRKLLAVGVSPQIKALEITTDGAAPERERAWISRLRATGFNLTNLTDGGEGIPGHRCSPERNAKISVAMIGNKRCVGRQISSRTRAKMSASGRGRHHTEESRAKMSAAKKGGRLSPEHCAKISARLMGNLNSLGFRHSAETRAKVGAASRAMWATRRGNARANLE